MATDNPSLIISVSAFGFGDSVVINGQAYVQEAPGPSVIVEAPNQKLFLYGERAMKERSGADFYGEHAYTGASATDASADTSPCTLVAVLWQQLKSCTDVIQKQEAANRICKHVVQLICDLKPTLEQEQSPLASLLNRSDLRAKAQIVLLIPDNFTEVEQQCLLNAFLGYDLRLLWRSVAALMGAVATSDRELFKLIRGNRIFTQNLVSSSQEPRTLVQVLYVGADSIDLSSYELKYERSSNYLVPVRQQAVYKDCAVGLNYLHFAVSSAHYYARQITTNMFEITRSGKGEQVEQSLFQQLINLNPNIWGINQDLKQTVLKVALGDTTKWVQLPNFKNNVRHNQALNALDIQSFYQSFGLSPQLPAAPAAADLRHSSNITQASNRIMQPSITSSGYGAMRAKYAASTSSSVPTSTEAPTSTSASEVSFVEQLASAIQNKIAASSAAYCFVVGPDQLVLDNTLFAHLNKLLRQNRVVRTLQFQVLSADSLSQGGMIFQDRLNQGLTTYLDRLPKLSTIVTNETQDEYQERVLIEEKEISPQDEIRSDLALKISRGASCIELFVSADPKFNQTAIERATEVSFKDQGLSVKKAELAFNAGVKAEADEPVTVSVMQKPLSGYVKIKITPQGESQVLPPYGVTRAFDPVKTPDYEGLLDRLARAYPPLTAPDENDWLQVVYRDSRDTLADFNTIFSSSSRSPCLVYYNGRFLPGFEDQVRKRLESDRERRYPQLATIKSAEVFLSCLNRCLPLTMYRPFGWPHDTRLVSMIQEHLEYALKWDKTRRNQLLRQYCHFVVDHQQDVQECCGFFLKIKELNSLHLEAIKRLLENHPRCFNPSSEEFCLTHEFAQLMTNSSLDILKASLKEVTAPNLIKYRTVKGSKKLSISLVILMYSLMYRCQDRNYLATPEELTTVENLLHKVEAHYSLVASEIIRTCSDRYFNFRVNDFVENKLKKLIPAVIEYLNKKGTNSNIMAEINDLNDE